MKINLLDTSGNSGRLILIFPGWSCGKELYTDFHFSGWDLAIVEEYQNPMLSPESPAILDSYPTIYLFAWSLGVRMAELASISSKVTAAFALNGTPEGADDKYGIPLNTFRMTAENLSPRNLMKFRRRMAGDGRIFKEKFSKQFSEEETELLSAQLFSILEGVASENVSSSHMPWKKVYLSDQDAIFPYVNMKNSWQKRRGNHSHPEIITLKEEAHYYPLERIISTSIPDPAVIAKKFSCAESTYDDNASAQKSVAEELSRFISDNYIPTESNILEIGSGTGIFTRMIINLLSPKKLDLVEISGVHPSSISFPYSLHVADAELWIKEATGQYDAVLSSSTMQWFIDLPLFISNVRRILKPGGVFAFSIFIEGNLKEMDSLRPSPLHYHSPEEIEDMMSPYFSDLKFEVKEIVLNFDSPSHLFSHLRYTGVMGSAPAAGIPLSSAKKLTSLTYRYALFSGITI